MHSGYQTLGAVRFSSEEIFTGNYSYCSVANLQAKPLAVL